MNQKALDVRGSVMCLQVVIVLILKRLSSLDCLHGGTGQQSNWLLFLAITLQKDLTMISPVSYTWKYILDDV